MGAGNPLRQWPKERWGQLVTGLANDGHRLVFTGRGAQEAAAVHRMCPLLDGGGIDLCEQLS